MTADTLGELLREALYLAVLISAPVLLVAVGVGVLMAVLQAATRIEERTLAVVPRLLAVLLVLAVAGRWMAGELVRFTSAILGTLPGIGRP
jgi:flagellar biosynthesis protein FliQ